eukprot:7377211-Prymnesium_polylepis.3
MAAWFPGLLVSCGRVARRNERRPPRTEGATTEGWLVRRAPFAAVDAIRRGAPTSPARRSAPYQCIRPWIPSL